MASSNFKSKWKTWARWIFVLAAAAALFWVLDRIGWDTVGDSFLRLGWVGAAILIVMNFVENFFDATALYFSGPGTISLWRIVAYNGAGAIVNVLVPFEAGEVLKATLLTRHMSAQDAISATVVWNYLFKLSRPVGALVAAAVGLALGADVEVVVALAVIGATGLAFIPYLALRLLIGQGAATLVARLLRLLRLAGKDPEALVSKARALDKQIQEFQKRRTRDYYLVLLLGLSARVASWFTLYFAVILVGYDLDFATCAMIYAAYSVASYVAMLLPARLGVGEGTAYLVFSMLGLDGTQGIIVFVILRIKAVVTNGLASLFAFHWKPGKRS